MICDHHSETMVSFCRLHVESSDTHNLRVVRGVVKTERVVDGGGDVVNFRAEVALEVAYSECPLTARVRLGIALALSSGKKLRDNCGKQCEWIVHRQNSNKESNSW